MKRFFSLVVIRCTWNQGLLWAVHVEWPKFLNFNSFLYGRCVFQFNAEIANCAIHLCMSQEELDSTQVPRFLIELGGLFLIEFGRLCSPHLMGAVSSYFQAN